MKDHLEWASRVVSGWPAWLRNQGFKIPTKKQPRMYQGMLDDFQESGAYDV